jgi:hypothetical protein
MREMKGVYIGNFAELMEDYGKMPIFIYKNGKNDTSVVIFW